MQPDGTGTWTLSKQLVKGLSPFVLEGLHQSAWFEASDRKIFVSPDQFPGSYVQGFIGGCTLEGEGRCFHIYPIIKIYKSGVLGVVLRMFSPDRDVDLTQYIREYRNAHMHQFDHVLAPIGFVKAVMRKDVDNEERPPVVSWWNRGRIKRTFSTLIDQVACDMKDGDFSFKVAPLFARGITPSLSKSKKAAFLPTASQERGYTMGEVAAAVISTVAYALGRQGRFTGRRIPLTRGSYWIGRPQIYITRHSNQQETASEDRESHGVAMGCILAGVMADSEQQALAFLPQSARSFEDYGLYVTREATLVAWSKTGLRRAAKFADANSGHLVYEQHAVVEAMDYGYVMRRRALELALSARTLEQALQAQQELVEQERMLGDASPFGELQSLLRIGWERMGMNDLRTLITEALQIRSQSAAAQETHRTQGLRFLIMVVLGWFAAVGIADQFVKPLWKWRSCPLPTDPNLASLVTWATASCLVVLVILVVWAIHAIRKR